MGHPRRMARTEWTRVWLIENRAGPANVPTYQGLWKAGSIAWPQGDVTLVRVPSQEEYGQFITVDKIPGEKGVPGLTVTSKYGMDLSTLLAILRRGCDVDLQVHLGDCQNPEDFNGGWLKILNLDGARLTDWTIGDFGALEESERATVNEESPFAGEDMYEIKRIIFDEQCAAAVVQEVVDIEVCDRISCGACDLPSDGCDKIFAITLSAGGSPGLAAEVVYSQNGGETCGDTNITTLAANEDPDDAACVGPNLVVISEDSNSLHYAPLADILAGTEVWTEDATGFVVTGEPRAIFSAGVRHTWIVGNLGYIYFTEDPATGVVVQDAGVVNAQDYLDVHAYDTLNVVAVGNLNTVAVTENGGGTWVAVVGPEPGVNLTTVYMKTKDEWWVGSDGGNLWYTRDRGVNWTQKDFAGDGAGVVRDIEFSTASVGWMAHDTATPAGRIFRTIDGGYSWYIAPESNAVIPANDRINKLAVCQNPNIVYGGGLADDGLDGIIVKGN